jgi:RHS repeat-associated protein
MNGYYQRQCNLNGQRSAIWDGPSRTLLQAQTYWGTTPVAYYSGGSIHYQHQDWQGTERARTSNNGAMEGAYTSLPFGDGFGVTYGSDTDAYHYAQLDHDSESGTEHAEFRQYSSTQGRWMSPDPYDGSYDPSDPQSLNRYNYVRNNPLSFIDPLGLDCYTITTQWVNPSANNGHGDEGTITNTYCSNRGGGLPWFIAEYGNTPCDPPGVYTGKNRCPNQQTTQTPAPNNTNANLPSCWAVGAKHLGNAIKGTLDPFPSLSTAATDLTAAGAASASTYMAIKADIYAAFRVNTKGGIGLISPLKSSTYRGIMAQSAEFAKFAKFAPLVGLDVNLGIEIFDELTNPEPCK